MNNNISIGQIGEEIACAYLTGKGLSVIERSFRRPWGELDIIAIAKDKALVFVEVKTMKFDQNFISGSGISPEDNMTLSKMRKTKKIATMFANENPELINEGVGWRIDLIAISIFGPTNIPLTDLIKNCEIKHFENVE